MQHLGGPPRTPSTRGEGGLEARLSCWSLFAPAPVPRRPPLPPTTSGRGSGFPLPPRGAAVPSWAFPPAWQALWLGSLPKAGALCPVGGPRPAPSPTSSLSIPSRTPDPALRLLSPGFTLTPPSRSVEGWIGRCPGGDHRLGVEAVRRPRLPRGWDGGRLLLYGVSGGGAADRGDAVPPAPDSDFSFLHVSGGGGQETPPSEVGSVPRGLAATP